VAQRIFEGDSEGRRRNMRANKSKNTKPEMAVRRLLNMGGYRFRLHRRDLPGCPDLVFPARQCVVEVRGCFWHGHGCFPLGRLPKTRRESWDRKLHLCKIYEILFSASFDHGPLLPWQVAKKKVSH
jgi:DNA mismatch endonuclease (patch repair protein)